MAPAQEHGFLCEIKVEENEEINGQCYDMGNIASRHNSSEFELPSFYVEKSTQTEETSDQININLKDSVHRQMREFSSAIAKKEMENRVHLERLYILEAENRELKYFHSQMMQKMAVMESAPPVTIVDEIKYTLASPEKQSSLTDSANGSTKQWSPSASAGTTPQQQQWSPASLRSTPISPQSSLRYTSSSDSSPENSDYEIVSASQTISSIPPTRVTLSNPVDIPAKSCGPRDNLRDVKTRLKDRIINRVTQRTYGQVNQMRDQIISQSMSSNSMTSSTTHDRMASSSSGSTSLQNYPPHLYSQQQLRQQMYLRQMYQQKQQQQKQLDQQHIQRFTAQTPNNSPINPQQWQQYPIQKQHYDQHHHHQARPSPYPPQLKPFSPSHRTPPHFPVNDFYSPIERAVMTPPLSPKPLSDNISMRYAPY